MEHQAVAATKTTDAKKAEPCGAPPTPEARTAEHPLLHLHQQFGNRAIGRFMQAKLEVSQPGDAFEQEADHVADQVLRMPDPAASPTTPLSSSAPAAGLQRMCAACEEQRHEPPDEPQAAARVQAKAGAGASPQSDGAVAAEVSGIGSGAPLPQSVRQF